MPDLPSPFGENSSFHSKIKVQTLLMSFCFDSALILIITLGKIIVSHQNDNLALKAWLNGNTMFYETFVCFYVSEAKLLCFGLCS